MKVIRYSLNHNFSNSRTDIKNLENYPLYLINSASGVTAVNSNNFNMLAAVIYKPRITENNLQGGITKKPIVEKLIVWDALPSLTNKYSFDKKNPEKQQTVWEHVYDYIFDEVSEYIPNKITFLEEFQKLKFLCAMTYIDFNFENFDSVRISLYLHEIYSLDWHKGKKTMWGAPQKLDKTPILDLVREGANLGDDWGLLKAGFFNGSIIRFNECYKKFSSHKDFNND